MLTLCPAHHAQVHRLELVNKLLSPLPLALWREQHPGAPEQTCFALGLILVI